MEKRRVDCGEVRDQLSEFIDRDDPLLEDLCREIEQHLKNCPDCSVKVDRVRKTIILYREAEPVVELPAPAMAKLHEALVREYGRRESPSS